MSIRTYPLGQRLLRDAAFWISLTADSVALLAVVIAVFIAEKDTTISAVLLLLALFALIALAVALLVYWRASRNASYKYAMRGLHQAVHLLRNEMARDESWTHARLKRVLAEVLTTFCTTFSVVIGAPCRACIKVIELIPPEGQDPDQIPPEQRIDHSYARTFCRDLATAERIGHGDSSPTEAPVRDNTAFRFLFDDHRMGCFVSNNLPKMMQRGQYANTSIHKYARAGDAPWSLPYKATMVWPIRYKTEEPRTPTAAGHFTGHQDIIGYLAIDTIATDAFDPDVDFEVGALLADALYIFLDKTIPEATNPTEES